MKAIAKSSVDCDDTSRESDTLICGFGPRRRRGGGDANSISSDNYGTEGGVDNMETNGGGLNSSLICGFGGDGNSHGSGSTIGRGEQFTSSSVMVTTANIPSSAYSSTSISIPTKTEEGSATRGIPRMDSSKSISSEGDMSMASEDAVVLMINMLEEAGDIIGGDHHHGNNKDHNEKYFTDEEVCGRVFKRQSITDYESIPTELEIESGALDQSNWSTSLPNNNHNSDKKKLTVNNENKVEKLNSHSEAEGLYTKSMIPQTTPELQPPYDTRSGPSSQPQKQCLKQTSLTKNVSINNHATYIAENGESNLAKGRNNIRTNKPTVSFQSISSSNNNNHMTFPSAVGSSEVDQNLDVIEEDESSDSSTVASDLKYSMLSEAATDVSSRVSSDASSGSDPYFSSTNLIPIGEHAKSMARQLKMNPSHGGGSTKRVRE